MYFIGTDIVGNARRFWADDYATARQVANRIGWNPDNVVPELSAAALVTEMAR